MNFVILGKPSVLYNVVLKSTKAVQSVLGKIDLSILFHMFIVGIEGKIYENPLITNSSIFLFLRTLSCENISNFSAS